jgi:hypothetical protein
MPVILAIFRRQRSGGLRFEVCPGQIVPETLSRKYSTQKRAGGVVEHLPSKCAALNSNLSSTQKKKNKTHSYFNSTSPGPPNLNPTLPSF